jgi:hypothetical protein
VIKALNSGLKWDPKDYIISYDMFYSKETVPKGKPVEESKSEQSIIFVRPKPKKAVSEPYLDLARPVDHHSRRQLMANQLGELQPEGSTFHPRQRGISADSLQP